jgi:hypothetical protein
MFKFVRRIWEFPVNALRDALLNSGGFAQFKPLFVPVWGPRAGLE